MRLVRWVAWGAARVQDWCTCAMTHSCLPWIIHIRHDSFICTMPHLCVTWLRLVRWAVSCAKVLYTCVYVYGVAAISRLLKIMGLFCRLSGFYRALLQKKTYNLKEPTNCSHPISIMYRRVWIDDMRVCVCVCVCVCEWEVIYEDRYIHIYIHLYTHIIYIYIYRKDGLYLVYTLCIRTYVYIYTNIIRARGGGLGSRPKKIYGERLGDGVEYHLMSPTPRC